MDCVELQRSLAEVEDGSSAEQRNHLRTCSTCSALVEELSLIITAANELQAVDEPSPRVWNSIEIALRQEGLIRPQIASRPHLPSFSARWGMARWLVPAAAMLLLSLGIYVHHQSQPSQLAQQAAVTTPTAEMPDLNDDDLLQEVADSGAETKTQFAENLRQVNDSIREAQDLVRESPNDMEARRWLMQAYQQKSMLFQMAMDRPLQ